MKQFWSDESGLDNSIEFTLLLAFVVLVLGPLCLKSGGSTTGIWAARDTGARVYLEP
jgi:Flp pilus assembly pilin Flp